MANDPARHGGLRMRAVLFGIATLTLYFLLYLFEDSIMGITSHGRWYFLVPVAIAFAFSFVHGNFTSYFWEVLGIKARK